METVRSCGCKGIRSCLICELEYNIEKSNLKTKLGEQPSYVYCPFCNKCWPGWDLNLYKTHPNHEGTPIEYPGVYIKPEFLNSEEVSSLMKALDNMPWEASQSGRRKQNFGPKCNFKKKRLRLGSFDGFPSSTHFVQQKFSSVPLLKNFQTVEQCTLEYNPLRGASIDPHIDDCWVWGERIVTVNVLGDSVLTMTPYNGSMSRYNLDSVKEYFCEVHESTRLGNSEISEIYEISENLVIRLPMPERSLMILYGSARYNWEHCVLREDVKSRRVCLAYRELTPPYIKNILKNSEVKDILEKALMFL